MADAQDSKSCDSNIMSVRPRPSGPLENTSLCNLCFFIKNTNVALHLVFSFPLQTQCVWLCVDPIFVFLFF